MVPAYGVALGVPADLGFGEEVGAWQKSGLLRLLVSLSKATFGASTTCGFLRPLLIVLPLPNSAGRSVLSDPIGVDDRVDLELDDHLVEGSLSNPVS